MIRFTARRYDDLQPVTVQISPSGHVASVVLEATIPAADPLPLLCPGLCDLQVNGYGGREFSSAELTVDDVHRIAGELAHQGTTRFLPTITTAAVDVMAHAAEIIAAALRDESASHGAKIAGIHLEGPFLSPEDGPRGAHPRDHCRPPAWEVFQRLQRAADDSIRLLTMAGEFPEAPEFIRRVTSTGVIVAIGHTNANGEQIAAAVEAGATLSTHLGNGAAPQLPRHPNVIWHQLAEDRLHASLIADGFHLPLEVLKSLIRGKTPSRCILVSDLSGFAGMPPGRYTTSMCELDLLADGKLIIAGQDTLLAGASRPLTDGIAHVVAAGFSRADAINMASVTPTRLLGKTTPWLLQGAPAHFTLLDWPEDAGAKPAVQNTMIAGRFASAS